MTSKNIRLMTLAAATVLAFSAPALAQQAPAQNAPAQQMQQINVSDSTMKEFVKVHQQVQAVQQTYQAEIQKAEDQAVAAAMMQKANEQATKAVEASPITVEEFNQIAMLLPQDQKLQQQYQKALGR